MLTGCEDCVEEEEDNRLRPSSTALYSDVIDFRLEQAMVISLRSRAVAVQK